MRRIALFAVFVFLALSFAISAHAQDTADANWPNLVRSLVRYKVIDLNDPVMIDEYSIITECDLYKAFYHDDFKWNKVRSAVRQSVEAHVATFPTAYHYDTRLQLDRYDFAAKVFRFTQRSTIHNVNSFTLFTVLGSDCGNADIKQMPRTFRAVIPAPIYMDGIPMSEADGQALVKQLDADQNPNRVIFARFNMHITYIEPVRKNVTNVSGTLLETYSQAKEGDPHILRLDAQMDNIEFYEDEAMHRLIYRYQL